MSTPEQIIELTGKVEALSEKIDLVDRTVQFNITLNWTIIIGVIAIVGIALYFISTSIIQTGIEKGINRILDDNKFKLNKKNPEMFGNLKMNSSENDDVNVRLVKLKDAPIINIESDKNNAELTINHKEIVISDDYNSQAIRATLQNGCCGEITYRCLLQWGNFKLIELSILNLNCAMRIEHVVCTLSEGFRPNTTILFNGIDDNSSLYNFTIYSDGRVFAYNSGESIKGCITFISHEKGLF